MTGLMPEQRLIAAVLEQGLKDRDERYIKGPVFTFHCYLLNLSVELVRKKALDFIYFDGTLEGLEKWREEYIYDKV